MKSYITGTLILFFWFAGLSKLNAQAWKTLPIKVTGQITAGLKHNMDSISIIHYSDCILFGSKRYKIPIDSLGYFHTILKPSNHPGVLKMAIAGNPHLFMNKDVEPGDSIFVRVDASQKIPKATYSGSISLRFDCEQKINEERHNNFSVNLRPRILKENLSDMNYILPNFAKIHRIYYNGYSAILDILESYQNKIPKESLEYLKARYTHFYLSLWEVEVTGAFERATTRPQKEELIQAYKKYTFPEYNYDLEVAAYNEYYLQHLLEKIKASLFLKSNGKGFRFEEMYAEVKKISNQTLRERLLVYFLLDHKSKLNTIGFDGPVFTSCLVDAQQLVQSDSLQKLLTTAALLKKGTIVPNFSMPDINGSKIQLSDFKGKVVMIDIWGEGCSGCARFHKVFKQSVYPNLERKSEFKVISIGINPTKEGWLRGISSGFYTNLSNINLFTEGLENNHPFIRHFGIQAVPFILLIDKKGLVHSKIDISMSEVELIKMINQATNSPDGSL